MNAAHATSRSTVRAPLAVLAALVALALLVVGVRQLTVLMRDPAPAGVPSAATAPTGVPADGDPAGQPAQAAGDDRERPPASPAADLVIGRATMGAVIVDAPFIHTPQPDLVTIGSAAAARAIPQLPAPGPAPGDGSAPGGSAPGGSAPGTGGSGEGPVGSHEGSASDTADRPIDGTVDLALGVRVETTGHFGTVFIGVGGGLSGGLAALRVDFGDGGTLQFGTDQIAALALSGRAEVVHEYEPTLTPQPQAVLVTATDATGGSHERTVDFATRAAYRLSYSPLAVTALDDCDVAGKGDFELTWRLDSRPARASSFKLGKGDTHHEPGFRIGIARVHFGEPLDYFRVQIEEHDFGPGGFPPTAFVEFPDGGPVAELGDHHYPVSMDADDVENAGPAGSSLHWDCDLRLEFTAQLTMLDSLAGR